MTIAFQLSRKLILKEAVPRKMKGHASQSMIRSQGPDRNTGAMADNSSGRHVAAARRARVIQQIPSAALRPFVKRFLVLEFPLHHDDVHLPDVRAVAAFTFRGRCRIDDELWAPPAAITGPRGTLRTHEHSDGNAVLLATFTAVGAAAFLPAPLEEFKESTVDLRTVFEQPEDLDPLREQIVEASNHALRVELLERFLLSRIRIVLPDPLISAAVDWLRTARQPSRVRQLAQYIGLSESALERRFRKIVGISPKRFASIVRLRHAVKLASREGNLTALAHAAGYFDQSHFIHDFRRATGTTPEAYFRQQAFK